MKKPILQLQNISKSFDGEATLDTLNLDIYNGEFLTLLGPSGCGKSTLLRLIAGFEPPDTGCVLLSGADITHLPPEERHLNMVFQSYALFPHMTVFENIAFGLRASKLPETDIKARVTQMLDIIKLSDYANRPATQLSGGQQQRVAIARAAVNKPLVLLLDEPLSALDYQLRKTMRLELKKLQRQLGITFIFVTHDQEEALSMSDRIVVMNEGNVEQIGKPRDIYEEPNNLFVANFIGETNFIRTRVESSTAHTINVMLENKTFTFKNTGKFKTDDRVAILIRPEDIEVWHINEIEPTENMLSATVENVIYKGSTVDLMVRLPNDQLIAATEFFDEDDEDLTYTIGEKVWIRWILGWEVIFHDEERV